MSQQTYANTTTVEVMTERNTCVILQNTLVSMYHWMATSVKLIFLNQDIE